MTHPSKRLRLASDDSELDTLVTDIITISVQGTNQNLCSHLHFTYPKFRDVYIIQKLISDFLEKLEEHGELLLQID